MGAYKHWDDGKVRPDYKTDAKAIHTCSAAGLNLLGNEKVELKKLAAAIKQTIKEAEGARSWEDFMSQGLLAAQLTKATCVAFLDMAAAIGKATMTTLGNEDLGKKIDVVGKSLNAGIAVAGAAASQQAGQKADWVGAGNAVAKAGNAAADRKKLITGDTKDLNELQLIKVDLVNAAIKQDGMKALQATFVKLLPQIGKMSLKYMGRKVAADWTSAMSSVANAGLTYATELDKAFTGRITDKDDIAARKAAVMATMKVQMQRILERITAIDDIMSNCLSELGLAKA